MSHLLCRKVESLQIITIRFIGKNVHLFENSLDNLQMLPPHVRNHILKIVLSMAINVQKIHNPPSVLKALANSTTTCINLGSLNVQDHTLNSIVQCTNLQKLYLNGLSCYNFSAKALMALLSNLLNLRELFLNSCTAVNDDVVEYIGRYCTKLYGLDIANCFDVTDRGLMALSNLYLRWLRVLRTQISDVGLVGLLDGRVKNSLTELQMNYCKNISAQGINWVVETCPQLQVIEFSGTEIEVQFLSQVGLKQIFWQVPFN